MVIFIKREKRLVLIINLLFFYLSLVETVEENEMNLDEGKTYLYNSQ